MKCLLHSFYFSITLQIPSDLFSFNNIFKNEKRNVLLGKIAFLNTFYDNLTKNRSKLKIEIETNYEKDNDFIAYEPIPRITGLLLNNIPGMNMKLKTYNDCFQKFYKHFRK